MNFILNWDLSALETFDDEVAFIISKWNVKEAIKFKELVDSNLERLSFNPEIGIFNSELNIYSLVISKQTRLFYDFEHKTKIIDLFFFWNNSQNPDDLAKLL